MGLIWFISVPIALFLIRKYRERSWGYYTINKSQKNKVFIVTGPTSGLGKETVKELVARDAKVIMACRDLGKAKEVITEIREKIHCGELIAMELDLCSFKSIRNFSEEVTKNFPQINVLINNAGVYVPHEKKQLTKDGHEIHFGVNHLGHFLLTNLLLDKLKESAPSRIVVVSSKLHESGVIDFDNLQGDKGFRKGFRNPAYNNSKLANIYFCRELAKKLPDEVETYALCPGFCWTGLFRNSNMKWYQYLLFAPVAFLYMRSARQGCQTILYCSLSDEVLGQSGKMFRDCKLFKSSHHFDDEVQKKLWAASESLTEIK